MNTSHPTIVKPSPDLIRAVCVALTVDKSRLQIPFTCPLRMIYLGCTIGEITRKMTKHRITFLPDEKSIEVADTTTIAEAAQKVGVHINNLCGGQGVCGECRVLIRGGHAKADEKASAFFSREEIEKGYVLACQTPIQDDL